MGGHDHHHFKGNSKENNNNNEWDGKDGLRPMAPGTIVVGIFKQTSKSISYHTA